MEIKIKIHRILITVSNVNAIAVPKIKLTNQMITQQMATQIAIAIPQSRTNRVITPEIPKMTRTINKTINNATPKNSKKFFINSPLLLIF